MDPESILASWTDVLTESKFVGNTLVQWLGLLGVLLGSFIVGKIVSFVLGRQGKRLEQREKVYLLAATLRSLAGPAGLLILAGGLYAASIFMNLTYIQIVTKEVVDEAGRTVTETDSQTKTLLPFWLNICRTVAVLAATWFIFKLVDVIEFFLKKWTSRTETTLDDQLVPLVRKTLRVFVVIVALLFIAQNIFEWNIGALVAGLGIGGLAFALAAKDMLANLFGSATIFADRPFAMGERVKIGEHDGLIEEVGFRSTRIRTLAGHLVTIPNATVANEMIENIGRRPYIKRVLDVTVTYDTAVEKVQRAVDIIREMLDTRAESFPPDKPGRVYFNDFNPASLNIVVYYWFTPPDWWEYLKFNHQFNMELLRRFGEEGIEFAFPTQTLYLKKDSD